VTAAVEPNHTFVAFAAAVGGESGLPPIEITPAMRLDDVIDRMRAMWMGGTDCSLPMRWALKQRLPVDVFVVYTDSETWAGPVHPAQALQKYREQMGIAAKLIVVGMTSNGFSIADPDDAGMLDVVGFDAATPQVMADFIKE
jgi:60 kDa SS-A/Ro ribonucleoprotein